MAVICPYCGENAVLIDSVEIYGKSYGWMYQCAPCDARVGCHGRSKTPLGRLANRELRELKKHVHRVFDLVWKTRFMTRKQAYRWLGEKMNLSKSECHVGMFDIEECRRAIAAVGDLYESAFRFVEKWDRVPPCNL